jgi:hypothetical protein
VRGRSVALATQDPLLYAELAGVLRERRLPSLSLLPGQKIPDQVAVVLTSEAEADSIAHSHVIAVPIEGDRTAIWAEVRSALSASGGTGELVVGLDPGPRPGFAVLDGRECIAEGVLESPEEAGRLGSHLRRRFPARGLRFRVGSGDRLARDRILNALHPLRRPIEVVNEQGTTPRGRRRPSDLLAARAIARGRGRPTEGRTPLTIKRGEIANVQRLSRLDSGGQFTISRALAEGVLRGELTMSEALALGERRLGAAGRISGGRKPPSSEPL